MLSNEIAFVNVSFKEKYIEAQNRLKDSIKELYPDSTLLFWSDQLPQGSKPFGQSLYGFKVHAIQEAINKGFKKIVWLDSCAIIKKPLTSLLELASKNGLIAVKDEQKLFRYISNDLLNLTGEISKDWNLVGGSLYIFDLDNEMGKKIFDEWKDLENRGYFGTQEMIMKERNDGIDKCGHRMDETCMAYLMYKNGLTPLNHIEAGYNTPDCVILKNHFVKEGEKWYQKTRAIHEHTVDISLFNGGTCIDVGCRGFEFSLEMQRLGLNVLAYDVEDMTPPKGIEFKKQAVLNYNGVIGIKKSDDKNATHIDKKGETVFCVDINSIYEDFPEVDVLKLDCEGSEYFILSENFKPIPKQITIEFHAHCKPEWHGKYFNKCMANLLEYYVPIRHKWTSEHCAGFNYWDSLFVRKDLL